MNLLVMGCSETGAKLASDMSRRGHDVSVVERIEQSLELLDDDYSGMTTIGNPIDQDTLRRAGIEGCDAAVAVTSSDNVNVMASQLAKVLFGVPIVITSIHDPSKKPVFEQMGLNVICPTLLSVDGIIAALVDRRSDNGSALGVGVRLMQPEEDEVGKDARTLWRGDMCSVIGVFTNEKGAVLFNKPDEVPTVKRGDRLIVAQIL